HVQQLGGPLALLPQRCAAARVPSRQQQRPGRAFAEPAGEQRRAAHLGGDDRLDLLGVEDEQVRSGWFGGCVCVGVGQSYHDAVVGGGRFLVDAVAVAQPPA